MEIRQTNRPTSSGRSAPAIALLDRAAGECERGEWVSAHRTFAAAAAVDSTPASRYAYAGFLCDVGEAGQAIEQLELAWELSRQIESAVWRARCCHALADLHRAANRSDLANRFRQWAMRAELDGGSDVDAVAWLNDRAADALARGELDAAETLARSARQACSEDVLSVARSLHDLGVVAFRQGRCRQAIRWLRREYHAHRRLGASRSAAEAGAAIGHVLQSLGEWRRAQACFSLATRLLLQARTNGGARELQRYSHECSRFLAAFESDPTRN